MKRETYETMSKRSNSCIIGVPEEKKKILVQEKRKEEIMVENF